MTLQTVSICTVSMNRLHHVKQTLPVNLKQNQQRGINFILLDYNSNDGLSDYVRENFQEEIRDGKLSYYQFKDAASFDRCHSRNLAFKLAEGDVVCNVDADNYAGDGFGRFVQKVFSREKHVCFTGLDNEWKGDASGKLSVRRSDFISVSGYDEHFEGYGYEDLDLVNRLVLNGCTARIINDPNYLNAIQHQRVERLNNESIFKDFYSLYVHFVDPSTSELLFLLSNARFILGVIQNNYIKNCDDPDIIFRKKNRTDFQFNILNNWQHGRWLIADNRLYLFRNEGQEILQKGMIGDDRVWKNTSRIFYSVQETAMQLEAMTFYTETKNRDRMLNNVTNKNIRPNHEFGKGIVYKNFNEHEPIEI